MPFHVLSISIGTSSQNRIDRGIPSKLHAVLQIMVTQKWGCHGETVAFEDFELILTLAYQVMKV